MELYEALQEKELAIPTTHCAPATLPSFFFQGARGGHLACVQDLTPGLPLAYSLHPTESSFAEGLSFSALC